MYLWTFSDSRLHGFCLHLDIWPNGQYMTCAICKGRFSLLICGTALKTVAIKPFISHVPRPYSLSLSIHGANGSWLQSCPSTGTTSVCPDKIIPPASSGPILSTRLDFLPSSLSTRRLRAPKSSVQDSTNSISGKLLCLEIVFIDTSFCVILIELKSGFTFISLNKLSDKDYNTGLQISYNIYDTFTNNSPSETTLLT